MTCWVTSWDMTVKCIFSAAGRVASSSCSFWEQEVLVQEPLLSKGAPVVRGDEAGSRAECSFPEAIEQGWTSAWGAQSEAYPFQSLLSH